jgi:heme-degrading monooxygenase HmoA
MYLVVSRWEIIPGKESEFEERGRAVREALRSTPGVKLVEGYRTDNGVVAIAGYESQEAYDRIVNDESGPFAKAAAQHRLEECGRWISSERGESLN